MGSPSMTSASPPTTAPVWAGLPLHWRNDLALQPGNVALRSAMKAASSAVFFSLMPGPHQNPAATRRVARPRSAWPPQPEQLRAGGAALQLSVLSCHRPDATTGLELLHRTHGAIHRLGSVVDDLHQLHGFILRGFAVRPGVQGVIAGVIERVVALAKRHQAQHLAERQPLVPGRVAAG